MTKISAQMIAHSKHFMTGKEIATMVVTFPRFILAEFNTHRMFSRNSASSRAIPFEKMLKAVKENPFVPIAWQKDHKGMQGTEYETGSGVDANISSWLSARNKAVDVAEELSAGDCTKQLCNRLLEPFMWHTVIVTATEWENFFHLRCPQYSLFHENMPMSFRSKKDFLAHVHQVKAPEFKNQYDNLTELDWLSINKGAAEIHMMALAEAMYDCLKESTPKELKEGQWHTPFMSEQDMENSAHEIAQLLVSEVQEKKAVVFDDAITQACLKVATARCARVSYTVVGEEGKKPNLKKDIELHDNLAKAGHWSPFEHCAKVMGQEYWMSGNFTGGWVQYRKMFANEVVTD